MKEKRPWYKKWWMWLIVMLVIILLTVGMFFIFWFIDHSKMPDVIGLSPEEAANEIQTTSEQWNIAIHDVYGSPYKKDDVFDFVVVSSNPSAGDTLSKSDNNLTIELTVDFSPDTLARIRESAIQTEIQHYSENGTASEVFSDEDSFILFRSISPDSSATGPYYTQQEESRNREQNIKTAEAARANIAVFSYTSDGFLYDVALSPYSSATIEETALFDSKINEITAANDAFVSEHIEAIIPSILAYKFQTWESSDYVFDGSTLTVYAYSPLEETHLALDPEAGWNAKNMEEGEKAADRSTVALARMLRCNMVIKFYSKGALEPFYVSSGEKQSWF